MSFDSELRQLIFGLQGLLRRHRRRCFLFFFGVMALTALGIAMSPRTYVSESSMFVRVGRESVALDPTVTTGATIEKTEPRESEINSLKDILRSRTLFE